jgi:hypothetical protein
MVTLELWEPDDEHTRFLSADSTKLYAGDSVELDGRVYEVVAVR